MLRIILSFITSFALCVVLMPLVVFLSKKLKVRQTILSYVDNHKQKGGTPTMGGIGFILALSISTLFFMTGEKQLTLITLLVTAGYGIVGFLDDFIKVYFKQNKGLSAWQKIVFQLLIAVIVSVFAYYNPFIGGQVFIPFTLNTVDLKWFAIPFYVVIFICYTNAVNLTDGLDGLAGGVTKNFFICFAALIALVIYYFGDGQAFAEEYNNLIIFCFAAVGALLGFNCYNGFPAKIFMGDTGALALGGAVASLSIVSRQSLLSPIIGIMYVITSLSVVLQVLYFKLTKKRIFLMAPLHHHFERKGIHENRIVAVYSAVTLMAGALCVLLILAFN